MDRIRAAGVFVATVERGSMSAAAKSLGMSRSMATRYLVEMEDWAGARLLNRSTRRLSLTPAGERVLEHCRELLEVSTEVGNTARAGDGPLEGLLRIGCSLSLGKDVLIPIFRDFLRKHPRITIDLYSGSEVVNLIEQRIDLAIRITNDLDPNLIARKLGECSSVVCAAPSYLEKCGVPSTMDDLSRHNCLTYSHFENSRWNFEHRGERVSALVSGSFSANDPLLLLEAVRAGIGISFLPLYSTRPLVQSGELVSLLPDFVPQTLGIHGVYSSRRHMPVTLRALIDALVDGFAGQTI